MTPSAFEFSSTPKSDAEVKAADGFVERLRIVPGSPWLVMAPHGGDIERHTDTQAEAARDALASSSWICKGWSNAGAWNRWHVTSTEITPSRFPSLLEFGERKWQHSVAFHGFGETYILVGGRAPRVVIDAIVERIEMAVGSTIAVKLAGDEPNAGRSSRNIVNALSDDGGIQIEQSMLARSKYGIAIAIAVADVLRDLPQRRGPRGFGLWTKYPTIEGGAQKVVDKAKAARARWFAVFLGDGAEAKRRVLTKESLKIFLDSGLPVFVWWLSNPLAESQAMERRAYLEALDEGASGVLVNAEDSYEFVTSDASARRHVSLLRRDLPPSTWIGHAPFAMPAYHPLFPYPAFASLDGMYLQEYAHLFGERKPMSEWIVETERQWNDYPDAHSVAANTMRGMEISPISDLMGREYHAKFQMAMGPEDPFRALNIVEFLEWTARRGFVAPSGYSVEAANDVALRLVRERVLV